LNDLRDSKSLSPVTIKPALPVVAHSRMKSPFGVAADAGQSACDAHSEGVFQHEIQLRTYIGFPVLKLHGEDTGDFILKFEAGP
jgi:hypothetical protein